VNVLIAPRSGRSFTEACARAGLEPPGNDDPSAFGEAFLQLLIAGVDFSAVGCPIWWSAILLDAPDGNEPL
jgi:hypothetical protein